MYLALQVLTVMLAAVTMALSLAHALEFPGKLRLKREQYLAVQPIYYPGFTIGGIAEPAVILATLALLIMTPAGTAAFWLVAGALAALITVQVIFWTKTQPANSFWLEETELSRLDPLLPYRQGKRSARLDRRARSVGALGYFARAGRNSRPCSC